MSAQIGPSPNLVRKGRRKKLALLLPAYNEAMLIESTINSAIRAGQDKADIYVVNDASTDHTKQVATRLLGKKQVLSVKRSGKAGAVYKAIKKFEIERHYEWLHIADADSIFSKNYFKTYRRKINSRDYVAAVGFVQSLRGNWICSYRAFTYTYGQHIMRRMQSWLGMISVMPGPTSSYRTDILKQLDFETGSLTEDFDLTLQIHRKKIGKIAFVPSAVNYTQDPQTVKDFWVQTERWYRGFFQGITKYRIGTKVQKIDLGLLYQILESTIYFIQLWVVIPLLILLTHSFKILFALLFGDFVVLIFLIVYSSVITMRLGMILYTPLFYFLHNIELIIFMKALSEVVILKRFRGTGRSIWETSSRRYTISPRALKETRA